MCKCLRHMNCTSGYDSKYTLIKYLLYHVISKHSYIPRDPKLTRLEICKIWKSCWSLSFNLLLLNSHIIPCSVVLSCTVFGPNVPHTIFQGKPYQMYKTHPPSWFFPRTVDSHATANQKVTNPVSKIKNFKIDILKCSSAEFTLFPRSPDSLKLHIFLFSLPTRHKGLWLVTYLCVNY